MSARAWIGGDVALDRCSLDELHTQATVLFTGATDVVGGDRLHAHVTLLYHGHARSEGLELVFNRHNLAEKHLHGVVDSVRAIDVPERKVHCIVLGIACDAAQDLHATVKAEVFLETGETSTMGPHLGPNGEHLYRYDYQPHITLAHYASSEALAADSAALQQAVEKWVGRVVDIGPFVIH